MQSNQPTVEEVTSDNIVEREIEPPKTPKRKKKKVSFAVWWELHATEEQKMSAENIQQQDASSVTENESLAKALETVDQKGDSQPPESESNEKNQVPFKTWSEEHIPIDQEISAGNIEKQNDSLVIEEESKAGVQETINIAEKEQPSKSKEQPPTTRRKKKKMIPLQIWLEKHAIADLSISAESTGNEDVTLDTKQESISVLKETPEKEQPLKSGAENVKKQDTFLLEEEGDQEDSLEKEICKEEPAISTTELVTEKKSISRSQEKVDQKEDSQPPEIESNEKNQVPFKTWSEEHVPIDQEISAGNIEKQNDSLISEEESIAGVQETINIAEKEQPSKSKEQPPTTRRKKKKMIPLQIWLEKHAIADLSISAESTGNEDVTLDTKQESISVLKETPEKEQPLKSFTENVNKQDTFCLEKEGDQEDSLMKEICKEEPVISTTQLVTEKKSNTKSQKEVDQKGEKQLSKTKRIKKTPLLWKSFPESDACVDLAFFTENGDINNGPLPENQSYQAALPISGKKTFWKMLPQSEPRIDVSFVAEIIETQNVSMPEQERDEAASLAKESYSQKTVISTTQIVTKEDQEGEKFPSTGKPKDNIQRENLTEVLDNQTAENVQGERLPEIQNLPHSSEKCMCLAKYKESELEYIEVQKYLLQQLDEMFNINQKLNAKLKQQKDLMKKGLSGRKQVKNSMVSVQVQTDSQDSPKQKTVNDQSASTQTEMDVQKTSDQLKPVCQAISTQTESDALETRCEFKPVRRTISTQTESDALETRCEFKPVYQTISTQTELFLLLRKQPSEKQLNEHQDQQAELFKKSTGRNRRKSAMKAASELETLSNEKDSGANSEQDISVREIVGDQTATIKNEIHANDTVIDKFQQAIEEETVSTTRLNGDHQDEKQPSKNSKRKNKRKAAMRAVSELENLNTDNVSGENSEQLIVSTPETVGDQTATIKNLIHSIETVIAKVQQITEEETVCITQQNGDHPDEKKPSKQSKRKNKRKSAMRAVSELENLKNDTVSGNNSEHQVVPIPETVGDQTAYINREIHANESVIDKFQQAIEEEMVSTTQLNGDQEDEKKPSKKSKRKNKRKSAMRAVSELENLKNDNVSGENGEQLVVSILETVGDQTATIKHEIHTNEMVTSKPQQAIEEETISTTQLNGDHPDEKKPSRKSKRKIRKKATMKAACELETLNNENGSGENSELQDVPVPETVGDQTAYIKNEIHANDTVIDKFQQAIEEETVSITQLNGDQEDEKKPSKKSKRKNRRKSVMTAISKLENPNTDNVSGENSEQLIVSTPETVGDQTATIKNLIHSIETVIAKVQQITEEETVCITQQNGDHTDEKKPSKQSKRKNKRKSAMRAVSELENLKNDTVSGNNSEHQVVPIPETVGDQTAYINREIHTKETAIAKMQQITEEETVCITQQNGDHTDEKKPSKQSKRKNKRKSAMRAVSELENLKNDNVSGENGEQLVVSLLETVGDQTATIKHEIHTNEIVTSKQEQAIEEETVSTTQQNEDQHDEKKLSRKSKRTIRRKAAMNAACELETLNDENGSGENSEHQVVSTLEIVGNQKASVKNEICTKETVIAKVQQITEEEMVSETQENGDHQDERRPLTKSKCKKKRKMATKAELETVVNLIETHQNLIENTKTPKTDLEIIPEIPQTAFGQIETKPGKVSEDVTGKVPVVSTEEESGLMETQRTSPPQSKVTLNEDVIETTPRESETQATDESAEQDNNPEQEENPIKKIPLWKRFIRALSPTSLRKFKDRCKIHPA